MLLRLGVPRSGHRVPNDQEHLRQSGARVVEEESVDDPALVGRGRVRERLARAAAAPCMAHAVHQPELLELAPRAVEIAAERVGLTAGDLALHRALRIA